MSESPKSWFHCARCGALFLSAVADRDDRQCEECGRNPSLGVSAQTPAPQHLDTDGDADGDVREERPGREKHRRRRHSKGLMIQLFVGWCAVMVVIVLLANHFWNYDEDRRSEWQRSDEPRRLTAADYDLLHRHEGECRQALAGLLAGNSPESINPFVFNAVAALPDMVRFYALNPSTRINIDELAPAGMSVIHLPDGPAIEGRWRTEDGRQIDVVFRNERGNWRVDWHHFARFSDHPWPLFLAGDGPAEGEFRLLARRRLASEELAPDQPLSLVFHNPKFADPQERSTPSPEFELVQSSPAARLLIAGLQMASGGNYPFDSLLPALEADDMLRVRVRVRRIDDEERRRFELLEVIACHWLQLDDPGLLPDLPGAPGLEPPATPSD